MHENNISNRPHRCRMELHRAPPSRSQSHRTSSSVPLARECPIWSTGVGRFVAVSVVVALALYGVLQAVDGVALKHAVDAWANAPEAQKAARFASAETVRWLEWGMNSY